MQDLKLHEQFEIEVLDYLNSHRILDHLIFGGGTSLRLCHELNRYSIDLDFYLKNPAQMDTDQLFIRFQSVIEHEYILTDTQDKYRTLLFEFRSDRYPSRLKIEINKSAVFTDFQQTIAFSPYSTRQVLLNVLSLDQMMENKVAAFLDRKEARDAHDIEFLVRRGIQLPKDKNVLIQMGKKLHSLTLNDIRVKLGSLLTDEIRQYYVTHGFEFLIQHIQQNK